MSNGRRFHRQARRVAFDDQIGGAVAETRALIERSMPGIGAPHQGEMPGWARQLTDRFFTPTCPRCLHLETNPLQPSFLFVWEGVWRCRACVLRHAQAKRSEMAQGTYAGLGVVEEHTCDRCRRRSDETLTAGVIRQDVWVINLGLCASCVEYTAAHGGRLWQGGRGSAA